jgi:hypothetical protein
MRIALRIAGHVQIVLRECMHAGSVGRVVFHLLGGVLTLALSAPLAQGQAATLNVTNYGARGDAVWFSANTTSNSVLVTTTNQLSSADIGKVIELFGAGPLGTSTNHQDLLAVITNVVNATNLSISRVAGATTLACGGVYGHNNAANFQNCIDAAPSNSVINIPNGTYLIIGSSNFVDFSMSSPWLGFPSLVIRKGGLTFLGQSRTGTILLGCGAWQNKGPYVLRGYMFQFLPPVINNGPLVFDNLTLDGGVQVGDTGNGNFPASPATGDGWDNTHRAFQDFSGTPFFNTRIFRNLHVKRWRGEQFYSQIPWDTPLSTQAIAITNCTFSDGNATALNLSAGNIVDHCTFSNLNEVCEYYEGYATHESLFQNCFVTNMFGAMMAFNGSLSNSVNPTKIVTSNIFYMLGQNGIQTTPAQNMIISNNIFIGNGGGTAIALGVAGYQGSAPNSNIVISLNYFTNVYFPIQVEGSGNNAVLNVQVVSNTAITGNCFAYGYGWSTNVIFRGNAASGFWFGLNSSRLTGQWYQDDLSNQFPAYDQADTTGKTNTLGYVYGMRHRISASMTNSIWVIDDTHPAQIPPGAVLQITYAGNYPVPLYLSSTMSGSSIVLTTGLAVACQWTNGAWQLAGSLSKPTPPGPPYVVP